MDTCVVLPPETNETLMIQRIQSIFLIFVAILPLASFFPNVWIEAGSESVARLTMIGLEETVGNQTDILIFTWYFPVLILAISSLASYSLLSYSNRKKQIKLNLINSLLLTVLMMGSAYIIYAHAESVVDPTNRGDLGLGFFLPALALVCNSIANRFIHKDEKLVRSVDRLR